MVLTLKQAALKLKCQYFGPCRDLPILLRVDHRQVQAGEGFCAFVGARVDGHDFIEAALQRGAVAIMAQKEGFDATLPSRWPQVSFVVTRQRTEDLLSGLAQLWMGQLNDLEDLVALTGSVGKTSARSFLASLVSRHRLVHSATGNLNTLVGCSISVLSAPLDTEVLILEMGANHGGEIAEMVSVFQPTLAAITEVAPAHLEGFGSLEGVLEAKLEIFSSPRLCGAVVNGDNEMLCRRAREVLSVPLVTVGRRGDLSFRDEILSWRQSYRLAALVNWRGEERLLMASLSGLHNLYPLCCALALALQMGLPLEELLDDVACCASLKGRGAVEKAPCGASMIDESYNASPLSMKAALAALCGTEASGRRIAVIGGMGELGDQEEALHSELLAHLMSLPVTFFLFGPQWKALPEAAAWWYSDADCLTEALKALDLGEGDRVLFKGSLSNGLSRFVEALRNWQ